MELKEIWEIVNESISDSFKSVFKNKFFFGSISASVLVFTIWKIYIGVSLLISFIISLAIIFFVFLLLVLINLFKKLAHWIHNWKVNSVYGDAIIILKDTFALVHLARKIKSGTKEDRDKVFMGIMMTCCDSLKLIFDKIELADCSFSIKVPLNDRTVKSDTVLVNLTRDEKNRDLRDVEKYRLKVHTILGNTAFFTPLGKVTNGDKVKHYRNGFVNGIDGKGDSQYLSSSKSVWENEILPYNSELVFPIVPIKKEGETECRGFLCVDTKKENAFKFIKYQVPILEGLADGIYDIIKERNERIYRNNIQEKRQITQENKKKSVNSKKILTYVNKK